MVLQKLLQLLFAHPQFGPRIVQKLADSWPIRRAAKMTAYFYLRGKDAIEQQIVPKVKDMDTGRFGETFKEELKKQWEEAKRIESQNRRPRR